MYLCRYRKKSPTYIGGDELRTRIDKYCIKMYNQ